MKRFGSQTGTLGPGQYPRAQSAQLTCLSTSLCNAKNIRINSAPRIKLKQNSDEEVGPGEHQKDKGESYFETVPIELSTSYRFWYDMK